MKKILSKGFYFEESTYLVWAKMIQFLGFFLLGAIFLGYIGFFRWFFLLPFALIVFVLTGAYPVFRQGVENLFNKKLSFFLFFLPSVCLLWLVITVYFAPFPAFSGRDEGSYANAAVYLVKNSSFYFKTELLQYFNDEGSAHKALNYPGFVIKNGQLLTQFSPAYSTLLAIFYAFLGSVKVFIWANALLVLGGLIAFYFTLKKFLPKWVASLSSSLLLFNFLPVWFARFTLSENLAFFITVNLLFFSVISIFSGKKEYLTTLLLLSILAPLTRPEGFWLMIVGLIVFTTVLIKKLKNGEKLKKTWLGEAFFAGIAGALVLGYTIYLQWPIYLQLVKDFIKWPLNKEKFSSLAVSDGGKAIFKNLGEVLANIMPQIEKSKYFFQVELRYGVLFLGIIIFLVLIHFVSNRKNDFYDRGEKVLMSLIFWLFLPSVLIFVAPQISGDHPWLLRRFFPLILPLSLIAGSVFIFKFLENKFKDLAYIYVLSAFLLFFLISFPAVGYFIGVKTDSEREATFLEVGESLKNQEKPIVFLQRESSGDGWKMFSLPLNSIYGLEAVYVYKADQIIALKKLISERSASGEKAFVVLPENAYAFEHSLRKNFNLIMEKQIDFNNTELAIAKNRSETGFPILEKTKNKVKIYSLNLK